jgi:peptide/nickel transport system substrate-binding protein
MTDSTSWSRRGVLAGGGALLLPSLARPAIAQSATDRIVFAMTQEPVQLNPLLYVNAGTENVPEACMFDALWDMNEAGQFIPNLAVVVPTVENGGISSDGLVWKITLKPGVAWSDGQPFTAADVQFTYETIMNPAVAVRSRGGFDLIKTFKIVDDHHIEIELSRPYVPLLWAWQNMHIVPKHLLAGEPNINTAAFNTKPIGTGPFLLRTRVAGSHMVYERNPNYHRGPAKVRQFIHKIVPDQLVLYGQAKTGEVDYMALLGVPNDRWDEARKIADRDFMVQNSPNVQFIYFNCGKPIFSDVRVRKALYIACEMQKSIDDVYFGTYERTLSYLSPAHWAYNHALKDETPNPERAAKLLDEAGWTMGPDGVRQKNGEKLHFTCSTTAGNPSRQATQALFQQNWKRIGVDMEIRNFPASVVWADYTTKSQFDTLLVAWDPTVGLDPDYTARAHSKQIPVKTGSGSNYTQYSNPEVDKLLEAGVSEPNVTARKKIYDRVQEILLDEVPFAPQGATRQGHLKKKNLVGVKVNSYVTDITWNVQDWAWA